MSSGSSRLKNGIMPVIWPSFFLSAYVKLPGDMRDGWSAKISEANKKSVAVLAA